MSLCWDTPDTELDVTAHRIDQPDSEPTCFEEPPPVAEPLLSANQRLVWSGSDIYDLAGNIAKQKLAEWAAERDDSTSSTKELRLVQPLGPRGEYSAVWLCEGPQQTQLVVKFFAEEFLLDYLLDHEGKPAILNQKASFFGCWTSSPSPQEQALREAMAYLKLRPLHGSALPLSYGFYQFQCMRANKTTYIERSLSPLQPLLGHVMEYIDHGEMPLDCVRRVLKEKLPLGTLHAVLNSIMQCILEVHRREVAHLDLSSRNMLVQWLPNEEVGDNTVLKGPRTVLFDFEKAQFGLSRYVQEQEGSATELFMELGTEGQIPEVFRWFNGEVGRDLFIEFATDLLPPEENRASEAAYYKSLTPPRLEWHGEPLEAQTDTETTWGGA